MTTIVRFAPSPTGLIHIGNARTALLNWLFAQKLGGEFVLRFDDTDQARSRAEFADAIARDLHWLGIRPDRTEYQSKRIGRYDAAAEKLKAAGRLYACYETADELARKRKRQLARGKPPVYDRAGLALGADEIAAFEAEGRKAHWRFKLSGGTVHWHDLVRGDQRIDLASLSDPVLVREDGSYLYTLPSVVDDIDFAISHVIRGEDHVANAGVQVDLFAALGAEAPAFGHHSLLIGADGKGLSKRLGSLSITALRDAGYEAMAVVSLAALIGTSEAVTAHAHMAGLVAGFDMAKLSRAPGRFDEAELAGLNAKLLHGFEYGDVKDRLAAMDIGADDALWRVIRGNLETLADARQWAAVAAGPVTPVIAGEDREFLDAAGDALSGLAMGPGTWRAWTGGLKSASGRKGRALFMPLRLALTGLDHGPELAGLLPLIGKEKAVARLRGEVA